MPRLVGASAALSRLGGGIGTRGPGETKLETDRRRIRHRISILSKDIEPSGVGDRSCASGATRKPVPTVALVGYTNAGKTTLFNALTGGDAVASDALFVTLDPLVRQVRLPDQPRAAGLRHGRVHRPPAAFARRGLPRHARGGRGRRPAAARDRRVERRARAPHGGGAVGAGRSECGPRADPRGVQQVRPARRGRARSPDGALSRRADGIGDERRRTRRARRRRWNRAWDSTPRR